MENQVVWVSANQTGRFGRLRFPGHAKVVDPDGARAGRHRARRGMAWPRVDVRGAVGAPRDDISPSRAIASPGTYLLGQEAILPAAVAAA